MRVPLPVSHRSQQLAVPSAYRLRLSVFHIDVPAPDRLRLRVFDVAGSSLVPGLPL
jgi:hypothetical protein